jgi:hypothetical protein
LDRNTSEAADTRDGDPFARPRFGFLKALVGCDAGAKGKGLAQSAQNRRPPEAVRQRAQQRRNFKVVVVIMASSGILIDLDGMPMPMIELQAGHY